MENEEYIESGLSVGATKIANKYEIFTEEEVDIINNKIPELDERVGVIEGEIEEINSSLDNKAKKEEVNNLQQQVNNLVLGAVGDGNNAEVVQARGNFSLLNERFDVNDNIRKGNFASIINNEIADILNLNPNMWISGDVIVPYTTGQTWKYRDCTISGFVVGSEYDFGLTTSLNHLTPSYIIEAVGHSNSGEYRVIETNKTSTFIAKTETITFRFQTISATPAKSNANAVYSGIYIRKKGTTIKDNAIQKKYDVAEILRNDEIFDIPTHLEKNATITHTGGTNVYEHIAKTYEVLPDTKYYISYETLIGNQLSDGKATVIAQYKDTSNTQIGGNTNLLFVNGVKSIVITTPTNCTKLTLSFMVSGATAFPSAFTVTWSGVNIVKGDSLNILLKEAALPSSIQTINKTLFDLLLPSKIYIAIGYPLEIYNHTICRCGNINNYHFIWKLSKDSGSVYKDKILFNPTDNSNNTTDTLALDVYDNNYNLVKSATSTIYYKKPSSAIAPTTTRKILAIGDSLTDISTWRTELYTRFNNDISSGKIEFLGTLGSSPYKHEGHSGWTLNNYLVNSSEGWNGNYKIKVSVEPTISSKKQYKFGDKVFEYEKTATENGSIWIYFNRISGGGFVTLSDSPCIQVDGSVSGDSSIAFTDMQISSFNPFYNSSTNAFDSKYYSDNYLSGVIPDDVIIWLGTNGQSVSIDLTTVKNNVTSEIVKYKTIVDNIKTNWANARIYLCYLHYRPNQNGLGYTSGLSSTKAYDNYVFEFNKQLFEAFGGYSNVIFIPIGQTLDRENNYPTKTIGVNTRNTQQITVASDTVHPDKTTGFLQFADAIYGAYVNNI